MKKLLTQKHQCLLIILIGSLLACGPVVKTTKVNATQIRNDAFLYYYLPEKKIKFIVSNTLSIDTVEKSYEILNSAFKVSAETVADRKNMYAIYHKKSLFSSDELNLVVSEKGLLESGSFKIVGEIPNIIQTLASAAMTLEDKKTTSAFSVRVKKSDNKNLILRVVTDTLEIKQSKLSTVPYLISKNQLIFPTDNKPNNRIAFNYELKISLKNAELINKTNENQTMQIDLQNGIASRVLKNIDIEVSVIDKQFSIEQNESSQGVTLISIDLFDIENPIYTQIQRAPFVEKKTTLGYTDGILVSNNTTNPSIAKGFITIPINVAKAIISVPASLWTAQKNNLKAYNDLQAEKLKKDKQDFDDKKAITESNIEMLKKINELEKLIKDSNK